MAKVSRRNSLPRGLRWPIATNDLRRGLGDLYDDVSVVWFDQPDADDQVSVNWKSEEHRWPRAFAPDENSATVWVRPTTTDQVDVVGDALRGVVLPELADWLSEAFAASEQWQALDHSKRWTVRSCTVDSTTHDESRRHRQSRRA